MTMLDFLEIWSVFVLIQPQGAMVLLVLVGAGGEHACVESVNSGAAVLAGWWGQNSPGCGGR